MNEYAVLEDYKKLICYAVLHLLLTLCCLSLAVILYSMESYLLMFFTVTIVWFSIKFMSQYTVRFFKKKPICEFKRDELVLHTLSPNEKTMAYKDIEDVKMKRTTTSIKLYVRGAGVEHPTGIYYIRIVYPFQKQRLDEVAQHISKCLRKQHVLIENFES